MKKAGMTLTGVAAAAFLLFAGGCGNHQGSTSSNQGSGAKSSMGSRQSNHESNSSSHSKKQSTGTVSQNQDNTSKSGSNSASGSNALSGTEAKIEQLHIMDDGHGWAFASAKNGKSGERVLKTGNGGKTWSDVTPKSTASGKKVFHGGFFYGSQNAWFVESSGNKTTVFHTNDGGQTWSQSAIPTRATGSSFSFINPKSGWMYLVTGAGMSHEYINLYQTNDGGAHWSPLLKADKDQGQKVLSSGDKTGMAFLNPDKGWITGVVYPAFGDVELYVTENGGKAWQKQQLSIPQADQNKIVKTLPPEFFTHTVGILPVMFIDPNNNETEVMLYRSTDKGVSWKPVLTTPGMKNGKVFKLSIIDGSHAVASDGNRLYTTDNAGQSWQSVSPGADLKGLQQLDFISPNEGWAVLEKDNGAYVVLRTKDGGHTWKQVAK